MDNNVGRLTKRLRLLGYDTIFVNDISDDELIKIALDEDRVLLTRDTQILKRRVATEGKLKVIFINADRIKEQLKQIIETLKINTKSFAFTRCLECNELLYSVEKQKARELVYPYVFKTQSQFMMCYHCNRVYWRGTHWIRMNQELEELGILS